MSLGPVFFLYFEEEHLGQFDAIMLPPPWEGMYFADWEYRGHWPRDESFNYTKIREEFGDTYNLAPRGLLRIQAEDPNKSWSSVKSLAIIDTERESQIGIGTDYPFGPLSAGECIVGSNW